MEKIMNKNKEAEDSEGEKKKRNWGTMIANFMMMGGIFVVLILIVGVIILVSYLSK